MPAAERGICRLKTPRDKGRKPARLFLQLVKSLKVVDTMLVFLANTEHHGCRCSHADLVRGPMHVDPVLGQALQTSDLVAHLIVEDLRPATGNRIQSRIP